MQNIDVRRLDDFRSQVFLEPLKRGFGHTLGNALRRVLLSSMPGCAPTEVIIKGVKHEYSAIEGVEEDVINILLNLKGVRLQLKGDAKEAELVLKFKGPGTIRAKDIELPHDVEILNPEHVIANVTQAKTLEMQIRVQLGEGYVGAGQQKATDDEHTKAGLEGNVLYLDASFSPVRKVTYNVENARVEQRTDFDRLVLDVETNGTISAEDAVRSAAIILQEELTVFSGVPVGGAVEVAKKDTLSGIIDAPIDDLELTVRSANALKSEGIMTVRDLVSLSEEAFMSLPNLGKKSLTEVLEALENHHLHLGMV